jgi:hypothetical protein
MVHAERAAETAVAAMGRGPRLGLPGAINWLAIAALLVATDYNDAIRGDWFLLARREAAARPVAPCLGGQNDRWYGSAEA